MTNTEISNNNPEKALKKDKSISDDKTKEISGKNATQNKNVVVMFVFFINLASFFL